MQLAKVQVKLLGAIGLEADLGLPKAVPHYTMTADVRLERCSQQVVATDMPITHRRSLATPAQV
jgi:hypothetical protein